MPVVNPIVLKRLPQRFSVCKVKEIPEPGGGIFFLGKTDEEISLVCETGDVPKDVAAREDGWRGFRVEAELDFSLVGILSGITAALAKEGISIFAVSTFNTDYVLVREENYDRAIAALEKAGYEVI